MKFKKVPHIGMRTFKTALAVTLSLLIGQQLGLDTPIFAAIGAISVMERTVKDSLASGASHLLGTLLGFIAGSIYVWLVPDTTNILLLGIGLLIVIMVCVQLKIPDAVSLTCVVFISQGFQAGSTSVHYGVQRFLAAVLGICIALLVNVLIKPYNNRKQLQQLFLHFLNCLPGSISNRVVLAHYPDLKPLQKQLSRIERELDIYDAQYFPRHAGHDEQSVFLRGCYQLAARSVQELSALCTMDETGALLQENAARLKKLRIDVSNCAIISQAQSNVDIVYNYHLEQFLDAYHYLQEFLE